MPHSLGHTITPSGQAERVQTNDGREPTQMMLEEGDGVNGWACANLDAVGERSCSRRKLVLDLVGRWSLSDLGPRGYKGLVLTKAYRSDRPYALLVVENCDALFQLLIHTALPTIDSWWGRRKRERENTLVSCMRYKLGTDTEIIDTTKNCIGGELVSTPRGSKERGREEDRWA